MNIHLKICENNVVHLGYDNLRVLNCLLLLEKFDCCFRDVHEEMNPNYTVKLCLQNFILIFYISLSETFYSILVFCCFNSVTAPCVCVHSGL